MPKFVTAFGCHKSLTKMYVLSIWISRFYATALFYRQREVSPIDLAATDLFYQHMEAYPIESRSI